LLLSRALDIPKALWRQRDTRRTFDAFPLAAIVNNQLANGLPAEATLRIVELAPDAASVTRQHSRAWKEIDHLAVFRTNRSSESVKIALDAQACNSLGAPSRPSQHLATLEAWQPLRVVLNGRADYSSGRYYFLREYHLIFCPGTNRESLRETRTVDLQADLY